MVRHIRSRPLGIDTLPEKHNITLRVITAYRPYITNSIGVQNTYRQHQCYLDITKGNRSTIQAILEDLCTDISQWREIGDQIFLMIELNKKIISETVTEVFSNVGLTEAITCRHRATGLVLTYQIGSHPIDVIYTSITFQVSSGGYLTFGIIPSYHHLLWLKIEFDSEFCAEMYTLVPHTARRLNCQKPDTVKRFIELYEKLIRGGSYIQISSP